jgi:signal transduction histidine kinase
MMFQSFPLARRAYLLMVILITIPFTFLAFQHAQYAKQQLYGEKERTLLTIATSLEQRIPDSFDTLVDGAGGISADDKRRVLYGKLQPILQELSLDWPGYGFGYYDKALGILALIPEEPRLLGTAATGGALKTYDTKRPETVYVSNGFTQSGEEILSINYPLYVGGDFVGHIWANVKSKDIQAAYYAELVKTFSLLVAILLIILGGLWWLIWNNKHSLTILAEHIRRGGEETAHFRDFPQIQPLLETVTDLRYRLKSEYATQVRVSAEIARLDRLNLISEMAAGVVHEVRNPMTVIRGYIQRMMLKAEDSQTEQYATIIKELDHMNDTLTAFLSLAKNRRVEIGLHNINGIIENLLPFIMADTNKAGIKAHFYPTERPLMVYADDREIRQLVLNLTRNAIEATPANGILSIKTSLVGNTVCITVADTGEGIAPWNMEKIFDPFFTTKDSGTGLGLAICKSIIGRHNGSIDVRSERGAGTVFTVELPVVA